MEEPDKSKETPEVYELKIKVYILQKLAEALTERLHFAALHIKAGKPWDEQCDRHIGNTVRAWLPKEDAEVST